MERVSRELIETWNQLKERGNERQLRNEQVTQARRGNVEEVMPGVFPSNWPKPIVANVIDTTARDLAEVLARLPNIDCASSTLTTDKAKKFAARKTKIALYYVEHSRLKLQLYSGADWFFTYAACPIVVEPDFGANCPRLRVDNPMNAYWETDLYGEVKLYGKRSEDTVGRLRHQYPELEDIIVQKVPDVMSGRVVVSSDTDRLEVVTLMVGSELIIFLPEREGLVLRRTKHRFGRPPVVIAERPRWDEYSRGQFDDVMWVWLARARMAVYGLEAAEKAVRAPLVVPEDVTHVPFGPDSIIRTNNPGAVGRVPLELPSSSLVEQQVLDQEIATGTRYPKLRSGGADTPSIATGPGMAALTDIYSTQIATAQDILGDALRRALRMAFEMDELYWPELSKTVNGTASGAPYTETYKPSRDIAGDYTVSVSYGMTAGMDPNKALVFLLQLRADQAIDRDTMQRMLPFEIDVDELQRRVDIEQITDALKQGIFALLANAPVMGEQGIDPLKTLERAARIIKDRENGKPLHQAILDAFTPEPAPQGQQMAPEDQMMAQLLGMAGGGGGAPGQLPPGDNTQLGQQAAPDLAMVLAGLTPGGNANMQYNVSRRLPM
jgi:hypothetical protein